MIEILTLTGWALIGLSLFILFVVAPALDTKNYSEHKSAEFPVYFNSFVTTFTGAMLILGVTIFEYLF